MCKKDLYFFVAVVIGFSHAFTNGEKLAIFGRLGPTFQLCAQKAGVTEAQAEIGRRTKDIKAVSPCFFTCIINETNLLTTILGKKSISPPKYVNLLRSVVPTISILTIGPLTVELMNCALEYSGAPDSDDYPDCPKTSVLVNCLAKAPILSSTITLAVNLPFV